MPPTPGRTRPYRIQSGQPLTIDIYGADGTRLQVYGILDSAPDMYTGDIATRIRVIDATARVLD